MLVIGEWQARVRGLSSLELGLCQLPRDRLLGTSHNQGSYYLDHAIDLVEWYVEYIMLLFKFYTLG